MIPELRAAILDVSEIKHFGNGYIDAGIKYNGKLSNSYKANTYFSFGTDVEEVLKIIEKSIINCKELELLNDSADLFQISFKVTDLENKTFVIRIKNNIAKYYPYNG